MQTTHTGDATRVGKRLRSDACGRCRATPMQLAERLVVGVWVLALLALFSLPVAGHDVDIEGLSNRIAANPELIRLGLLPLGQGAAVKRDDWSDITALVSTFQQTARIVGIGTPAN